MRQSSVREQVETTLPYPLTEETRMKTLAILSAASALVIAGTVAYAQPAPPAGDAAASGQRGRMTRADFDSLTDARIAAIQAGLKLTPDQQKLWGPVEQAVRAMATTRAQRMQEWRERIGARTERPDLMQRLEQRSAVATKNAESLSGLSTAMKPFWASLDDRQKRLLPILMRSGEGMRRQGFRDRGERRAHGMRPGAPTTQQ
jgi:zinc resistance-associated protein